MDVGGTFTDRAALAADGRIVAHKVLSTPGDQGEGVVQSLDGLDARAAAIVHGTTVVTNLLLERRGARVVLVTTAGAEDVLFLRRQDRAALYDLSKHHPAPLVAREDVIGVDERLVVERAPAASREAPRNASKSANAPNASSTSDAPSFPGAPSGLSVASERSLSASEITRVTAAALARNPEIVLVALLHSYADDSHERAIAASLRSARPDLEIVTSADVLPEIREYERFATASAEAYARPAVIRYLDGLAARLAAADQPAPAVMTSGGGMQPAAVAARHAAALALSGPAGGVVGAAAVLAALAEPSTSSIPASRPSRSVHAANAALASSADARAAGLLDALTIDIGGTSADAGLILDGEPLVESGGEVAGVPIALPRVLVDTVSAGGGSIAWIDDGGALRVGPRSAGAKPGPVAFGRGGTEPTVTDAQLVLGRIAARAMSGGVALDIDAARAAVGALAARLGSDVERTAAAILRIADAEMARALRRVSVERGVDPRRCTLIAFGGGGPLHACALADTLAMPRIIVPPFAGVLSAVGLALAPERRESAMSVMASAASMSREALAISVHRLSEKAEGRERRTFARMRYRGQGHELEIPVYAANVNATSASGRDDSPDGADDGPALAKRFAEAHAKRYGFTLPSEVEIVALRHEAGEPARRVAFAAAPAHAQGGRINGPHTLALSDATLYIAEGWVATPLPIGGWQLERAR